MEEYGTCAYCRRTVGAYIPSGGDGLMIVPRAHNDTPGHRCVGSGLSCLETEWEIDTSMRKINQSVKVIPTEAPKGEE